MSEQDEQAEQAVGAFTIAAPPEPDVAITGPAPTADDTWPLPGGTAHVYRGRSTTGRIVRPVIISDGFGLGRSNLDEVYLHLDRVAFPLVTTLRQRDRDVILLGYDERSASLLDNAKVVVECIRRAQAEQIGKAPLVVGGLSMGGLLTRYALADMENRGIDHRTAVYFSFDSPHRGAVIPVGLQAFAHFIRSLDNNFARQMNSPAARQMLWRHYDPENGQIGVAPERTEFLKALKKVGGWPQSPRLLGVANGRSDGRGLPIPPRAAILTIKGIFDGTVFYAQAQGKNVVVAELVNRISQIKKIITTNDFPELDGAPSGTMRAFHRLAEELRKRKVGADLHHDPTCFIPTVSAVDIRDIDDQKDLYTNIDRIPPRESGLHEFRCSSDNTAHATVTSELATWLLDRLPD